MRINEVREAAEYMKTHNGGSSDYNELTNKPTINGVTVEGALTSADLNIPTTKAFTLIGSQDWLSGEEIVIDDSEKIALLNQMKDVMHNGGAIELKIATSTEDLPYNVFQNTEYYYESGIGDDQKPYEVAAVDGLIYIGLFGINFVRVNLQYNNNGIATDQWSITLTPLGA